MNFRSNATASNRAVKLVRSLIAPAFMVRNMSRSRRVETDRLLFTDAIPKKRGPKTDVLEALLERVDGLEKRLRDEQKSKSSDASDDDQPNRALQDAINEAKNEIKQRHSMAHPSRSSSTSVPTKELPWADPRRARQSTDSTVG